MERLKTWEEFDKDKEIKKTLWGVIEELDNLYNIGIDYDMTDEEQLQEDIRDLVLEYLIHRETLKGE